jgi:twinkle protein
VLNVVSVPAGATDSETATLEYLNTCYDYLKGKKFIIATDNDPKGIAFRNVLASRLGKDICRYIQFPDGIKDANELLVKVGRDSFTANYAIRIFPLEGIETVQDVEQDLDQLFVHGYPVGAQVGYSTFDKHLSFFLGHVGVYTGIPGHGKSELTDQLLVNLSERSGWKHAVFSAENQPLPYHLIKLAEKYTKKAFRGTGAMSIDEYAYAKYWLSEHFFFIKFSEVNLRLESILDKARELILRHGVSNLIIDNWANLEHAYEGETEHQYIGKSLIKVMNFARMYNVHVMLVAHPTKVFKSKETGLYEVPNLYSISGSSHWFNKPDYGITVYRNMENNETSVHIQKCRWKYAGKVGAAVFTWNPYNGIYNEIL